MVQNLPNAQNPKNNQQNTQVKKSGGFDMNPLTMAVDTWNRLQHIATEAAKSGLLPKAISTPQAALIIALKGLEMGFSPLQSFERISVVNGKAVIDGQGFIWLIMTRSPQTQIQWLESTNEKCTVSIKVPNQEHAVVETFTMDDARRADLLGKDNWKKYPKMMLRWRTISAAARIAVPHLIGGLYLADEMGFETDEQGNIMPVAINSKKIDDAKNVTPEEQPQPLREVNPKTSLQLLDDMFQIGAEKGYTKDEIRESVKARYPNAQSLNSIQLEDMIKTVSTFPAREPLKEEDKFPFEKAGFEPAYFEKPNQEPNRD